MSALATDLLAAGDAVEFARMLGLDLDPWQQQVVRSRARRMIVCAGRQTGKSACMALAATHTALYRPPATVVLASPTLEQSQELFGMVMAFYRLLGRPIPTEQESALQVRFRNGSRIISMPGSEKSVRGKSAVDLLCIDEAARVEEELLHALRPMQVTARDPRLIVASTPAAARGWFYRTWIAADPTWERIHITSLECERVDREEVETFRRERGELAYRQEFLAEFVEATVHVFRATDVQAMFERQTEGWEL